MRSIFYNETGRTIRAGWRMGIFVAVLMGITTVFSFPAKLILPHIHFIPSFASGEMVFYGALFVATWLVIKFLEGRPAFQSVGFPRHGNILKELGQGTLIGGGMMTIIFVTEHRLGMAVLSFKTLTLLQTSRLFGASAVIFVVGAFG